MHLAFYARRSRALRAAHAATARRPTDVGIPVRRVPRGALLRRGTTWFGNAEFEVDIGISRPCCGLLAIRRYQRRAPPPAIQSAITNRGAECCALLVSSDRVGRPTVRYS